MSSISLKKHFATLRDPRIHRRRRHLLIDIVIIAVCAVIGDCDNWIQIANFGKRRQRWFKRFLKLPEGIPSHDTFERVFDRINPQAFQRCFLEWTKALSAVLGITHIAIDGKTLRSSAVESSDLGPLHLVSAWATEHQLTLGQVAVEGKSNEITAIPKLLELLDLHGALVTIDAMGCQREIAQKIVDGGGDYVLTVKENQEGLLEDIQATVQEALDGKLSAAEVREYATSERGHGRQEERSYVVIHCLEGIRDRQRWAKLTTVGMCYSERTVNGETSTETRYFIGSKRAGASYYGKALRNHWRIENQLHWQMDLAFGEDGNRTSKRHAAENLALMRRIALALLKRHPAKGSVRCKRKEAALDVGFLEEVLKG